MNYSVADLKTWVERILCYHQLPGEQAKIVADCFVTAEACGVSTHGISVLPAHLKKIDEQAYCLNPDIRRIKGSHSFALVDADNAIGPYAAAVCMDLAVSNAKKEGIFTVFAKNCNTYGPAFYYPYQAVQNNLIGVTFCNTPAAMAPWGGKEKLLGTNPFAAGIPGKTKGPILFDMATSKVAKSKINEARLAGSPIPPDWALDINGRPTTDPLEAIRGLVLPMAEYKGSGISMMIDILAGMLSGAAYASSVNKFYSEDGKCMNVGQVFIAIDPTVILSDGFYSMTDDYIDRIHHCASLSDKPPLFPGERKKLHYEKSLKNGVTLSDSARTMLHGLLEEIS